jgi:hypothetical protein
MRLVRPLCGRPDWCRSRRTLTAGCTRRPPDADAVRPRVSRCRWADRTRIVLFATIRDACTPSHGEWTISADRVGHFPTRGWCTARWHELLCHMRSAARSWCWVPGRRRSGNAGHGASATSSPFDATQGSRRWPKAGSVRRTVSRHRVGGRHLLAGRCVWGTIAAVLELKVAGRAAQPTAAPDGRRH